MNYSVLIEDGDSKAIVKLIPESEVLLQAKLSRASFNTKICSIKSYVPEFQTWWCNDKRWVREDHLKYLLNNK